MSLLERLLDGLDVEVEPFAICLLRGTSRLDMGRHDRATLHYTLAGTGVLRVGAWQVPIAPHTIVIVPPRASHSIRADLGDGPRAELPGCAPLADGWELIEHGGAGAAGTGVQMACSELCATYDGAHGLFDFLTEPLVERLDDTDPLHGTLKLLLNELAAPGPGTRALTASLMRQCLVLILRRQSGGRASEVPWLAALDDPRLGAAVTVMLDRPQDDHNLARLADAAGMSRSAFADRFSAAFGRGPMDFLKEIRLRRAARLLRASDRPIKVVATSVGYDSRSYFSRAFKDLYGVSPADYRAGAEG